MARSRSKFHEYKKVERFAMKQLEKYIRLHKKHEKTLNYIG